MSSISSEMTREEAISQHQEAEKLRVKALMAELQKQGLLLAQKRDFDQSLSLLNQVLGIAKVSNFVGAVSSALHNLAIVISIKGDLNQAIKLLEEAISLCERADDPRLSEYKKHLLVFQDKATLNAVRELQRQAPIMMAQGNEVSALATLRKARKQLSQLASPNSCLEVSLLVEQANVCGNMDDPAGGLAILQEARELVSRLSESEQFAFNLLIGDRSAWLTELEQSAGFRELLRKASALDRAGDLEAAEKAARAAFQECCRSFGGQHYLAALGLDSIGVALVNQAKPEEAMPYFEKACRVASEWPESAGHIIQLVALHTAVCEKQLNQGFEFEQGNDEWSGE